jgi:S1-C subfamily serine protease
VSVFDLLVILFVLFLAWRGARTGFLAGALSLAGVILGATLGSRLVPALLGSTEDLVFGSVVTLTSVLAFAMLGDVLARSLSRALRERIKSPISETLDRTGGAILGAALSLTVIWVAAFALLGTPLFSTLHPAIQESRVLQALNEEMPSRLLAQAISRLDPLPSIRGPEADVAEPDSSITRDPDVLAATSRIVRITGVACGLGVEGSGWVAAPDLIATNAHVVAGERITYIQPEGTGLTLPAQVVVFDEKNDIAVLRVENLRLQPLPTAEPQDDTLVAILGFPENGPFDVRAARIGDTMRVISSDAYNRGPVERVVTSFRGFVRPGNSGGPAVNENGEIVATVFASRADSGNGGYGIPSDLVEQSVDLATERQSPVSTQECAL